MVSHTHNRNVSFNVPIQCSTLLSNMLKEFRLYIGPVLLDGTEKGDGRSASWRPMAFPKASGVNYGVTSLR